MQSRPNHFALGVLFMFPFLLDLSAADIYFKQRIHQDAMTIMGQTQSARDLTAEIWLTPEKVSMSSDDFKNVLDWGKKLLMIADHGKKTILQIPLDFEKLTDPAGERLTAQERAEFQKLLGQMAELKITVQPTGERKTIGRWQCRKYIQTVEMSMAKITSEIWATQDIGIDEQLYAKFTAGMLAQLPGVAANLKTIMEEMKKIKGVHVLTLQKTEMMGGTFGSRIELLEFKEGKAPAEAFAMPSGYQKQEL